MSGNHEDSTEPPGQSKSNLRNSSARHMSSSNELSVSDADALSSERESHFDFPHLQARYNDGKGLACPIWHCFSLGWPKDQQRQSHTKESDRCANANLAVDSSPSAIFEQCNRVARKLMRPYCSPRHTRTHDCSCTTFIHIILQYTQSFAYLHTCCRVPRHCARGAMSRMCMRSVFLQGKNASISSKTLCGISSGM